MKVETDSGTYLMHWEARKFSPSEGKNTNRELEATDCIIRQLDSDGNSVEIARGHVSQTSCDQANGVTARRLSFVKAIKGLDKPLRKALGHEYQKSCRVFPMTFNQKNRKLRKRISDLTSKIETLEKASDCKCVKV